MNINLKQEELINTILTKAKEKYPEIVFNNLTSSPDDPEHIWVNIMANFNDDKFSEFLDFAAELDIDILLEYGYKITLMAESPNLIYN
jgi:hypothetical protein